MKEVREDMGGEGGKRKEKGSNFGRTWEMMEGKGRSGRAEKETGEKVRTGVL